MHAYIYARFSTLEQAKGSSLERQLDDCRMMCARHGWDAGPDRELVDEGRSAYDGTNRAEGSALARFERDAIEGRLPPDTVLVVERLDRLSRQSAEEVFRLVTQLTDRGVVVATVDGDRLYRHKSFGFEGLIELVVKAHVSHEESEKKSQRLSAAWAKKRSRAVAGDKRAMTRRCPAWIAVCETGGEYVLVEERAAVVRRIFDMATSGHGKHMIARALNTEGVAPWGGGNGWHPSYIQKILSSRTTIGEMQPHRKIGGKRVIEGERLTNYYPAVIDEAMYERAQSDRAARTVMRGRRGRRVSNLFTGIVKCRSCSGPMTFRNKGGVGEQYLVCDGALRGRGCVHTVHFNYPVLEAAIIDQTLHDGLADRHFGTSDEVKNAEAKLAEGRRRFEELENRQRRLVDLLSRMDNPEIERQLGEIGFEIIATKTDVYDLEQAAIRARGARSPYENLSLVRSLLDALRSDDEGESATARGTVQQAIRALIKVILCDPETHNVIVDLDHRQFTFDRRGRLQHDGVPYLGLVTVMEARERGWVVKKYEHHPAFGRPKK